MNTSDNEHWHRLKWQSVVSTNYTDAVAQLAI